MDGVSTTKVEGPGFNSGLGQHLSSKVKPIGVWHHGIIAQCQSNGVSLSCSAVINASAAALADSFFIVDDIL